MWVQGLTGFPDTPYIPPPARPIPNPTPPGYRDSWDTPPAPVYVDLDGDGLDDHQQISPGVLIPLDTPQKQARNHRKLTAVRDYTIYHGMTHMGLTGFTWNKVNSHITARNMRLPSIWELELMKSSYITRDGDLSQLPAAGKQWVPVSDNSDWYHVERGVTHATMLGESGTDVDLPYNGALYYTGPGEYTTAWDTWPLGFQHFEGIIYDGHPIENGNLNESYYSVMELEDGSPGVWSQIPDWFQDQVYDLDHNTSPTPFQSGSIWYPEASGTLAGPWTADDLSINHFPQHVEHGSPFQPPPDPPTPALFESLPEVVLSPGRSGIHFIQSGNIPISGAWTFTMDAWFTDWNTSDQSIFVYQRSSPYKMFNLYNPGVYGPPKVFLNNQSSYPEVVFNANLVPSQAWFNYTMQYDGTGTWTLLINDNEIGTMSTTDHTFTAVNDISIGFETNTQEVRYRNVRILEGLVA